jgi:hypothetical protein
VNVVRHAAADDAAVRQTGNAVLRLGVAATDRGSMEART